jgi:hypothetical protein
MNKQLGCALRPDHDFIDDDAVRVVRVQPSCFGDARQELDLRRGDEGL